MTSHIFSQFDYWKECAEEGNTQAQYNLGEIYYHGDGVKQDYSEALKWFRKAAEDGLAKAQFMLGVMYENGLGVDKNDRVALSWYLKAAEQGYTEAIQRCDKLAEHVNVNANIKAYSQLRAYKKKRLVQEQRQKRAKELYHHGLTYLNGEGVKQNYPEAIKCFEQAASLGHYMAKQKLDKEQQRLKEEQQRQKRAEEAYHRGISYLNGEGVTQDYSAAIKCFEQVASLGHSEAKQKLDKEQQRLKEEQQRKRAEEAYHRGISYLNEGINQDYLEAIKCFEQAASLGHVEAKQKRLEATDKLEKAQQRRKRAEEAYHRGISYLNEGINQDYLEAIKCFEQAASLGHPEAKQELKASNLGHAAEKGKLAQKLYQCGRRYYFGLGVIQDRKGAIKLYRKAAQLGYVPAQDALRQLGATW